MSVQQVAAPYRRLSGSLVAAIVVGAFAIGALAGFGVPRVIGLGGQATVVAPAAPRRTSNGSMTPIAPR